VSRRRDTAVISSCGRYRSYLTRELDPDNARPLVICGLNPSTADAATDDPTLRREIDFARRWGCGRLIKVNAYDWRATEPAKMFAARDAGFAICSDRNRAALNKARALARRDAGIVLVAWGARIEPDRQAELAAFWGDLARCLAKNQDGTPVHPLYQPRTARPRPWTAP
jgi:hypothetical protein